MSKAAPAGVGLAGAALEVLAAGKDEDGGDDQRDDEEQGDGQVFALPFMSPAVPVAPHYSPGSGFHMPRARHIAIASR
jgi:hypothetical protein